MSLLQKLARSIVLNRIILKLIKTSSCRELHTVQEHDREVTKKASETQDELKEALIESERNANLLAEYHELYELQRRRLEFQICMYNRMSAFDKCC